MEVNKTHKEIEACRLSFAAALEIFKTLKSFP